MELFGARMGAEPFRQLRPPSTHCHRRDDRVLLPILQEE